MHKAKISAILLAISMLLSTSAVQADSFLTSVSTKSKTAARLGPGANYQAYNNSTINPRMIKNLASRALRTIRATKNMAIAFEVLRIMDSISRNNPKVGSQFRLGLAKLAKTGDPKFRLLRGVNLIMRRPGSDRGIAYVRQAAREMPGNSAAQLLTALSVAQRDGFAAKFGSAWEKPTRLKKESARHLNNAQQLEQKTNHPRPLVRTGIQEAKQYMGYYEGFNGLIK